MGRGKALSNQEYWWIIGLHDGGVSLHEIARRTGRARTCVRKAIKTEQWPLQDSANPSPRPGRPPALTEREVRLLVRKAAVGDRFAAELKTELGLKASVRTVQRLLQRVDHLVYTKMDRTLPLTAAHKAARMEWAKEHILNPDEKKFNLDGPDGFKYYWRDMRQPAQSFVRRQNGGGSVMVWGGHIVLKQDNASIHASRETTSFLQEMEVNTMAWPARSPDRNPILNVWSVMAARVYAHGRQYRTVGDLEKAIMAAWASIEQEYLCKLVESMPRRCLAVIKQKGGLTKY
ncbi:hypothetical protein PF005_g18520 [Phytophthora fragariae]|uniref:Tc3 transposase DNA binding domain-containing protein n=1 Tax=Phytophthora fragariae TaxID=53985 RepID=A0A6A3X4D2_9STRA|nr:hypothetical protein PF005_g18520 [Phytophthora fragariae]